ncbi:MAG: hypothetical protein WD874_01980 [Parcubacteria group bacterium]
MAVWQPLIVCDTNCGFGHLILLANNLITNLIILSTIIATAVIIFAGFKLVTSGGNIKAKEDAKKMLGAVVKGYVVILIAWLLIYTITNALLKPGYGFLLGQP